MNWGIFGITLEIHIQGGPEKNGTAYFPQYLDRITNITVWGNISWEKKMISRSPTLVQ